MLERSRIAAFYMCFVDIIITICVQVARLRFVSGFIQWFGQLKRCVRHLKPNAFEMPFAGRDLHILLLIFVLFMLLLL